MIRNLMIAAAFSLGLLTVSSGPSMAGVNIDLNIGGKGRISCRQGAGIVANAGYRRVRPVECNGSEYTYRGIRRDSLFNITVRSRNGSITGVDRIRRGGGGGYGDDYEDDEY